MRPLVMVVTSLEDVTADMVIDALNKREVAVARVDPADIGPGLRFGFRIGDGVSIWDGRLRTASREIELRDVGAVYHRRPTPFSARFSDLPDQQRDFAVAEARHGLGGVINDLRGPRYVNHPAAVSRADFKPAQLEIAALLGLAIPPTLITNDADEARAFAVEHGRIVYKTFRGLPRGPEGHVGAIWTQRVTPDALDDSITVTAHLFQAEIAKSRDVRVTMVGDRVFAQLISTPDGVLDWRQGDWGDLAHASIVVPASIEAALRRYLDAFGLVFGCFDFALTGDGEDPGRWVWIECNPNGQWGWLPDAPEIAEAFADILSKEQELTCDDTL